MIIIKNFPVIKQKTSRTCSLAVLRMLYNYFKGADIFEEDIAKNFFLDRIIHPRSFFQRYFYQLFPEYQIQKKENISHTDMFTILENQLHQNLPVPFINTAEFIKNQKKFGILHFALIIGIDREKEIVYIADPNPNDQRNIISFSELFDRMAFSLYQDKRFFANLAIKLGFLKKNTIFEIKNKN